jgi:sulfofructose kinase
MGSNPDIVGVGLNATDTLILVPHLPAWGGKAPFTRETLSPGGQVATALVACAKLGLRAKYIGTLGDDERGRIQLESLQASGIDIEHIQVRRGCPNQSAYIVVDGATGERTVFWHRPECLRIEPAEITTDQIAGARMLHIDGHDTAAVERAARIARAHGIPVSCDVDTIYPGFERVLPLVDYLVASSGFPALWTGLSDPFDALARLREQHGMRVAAMTLGAEGALALSESGFVYSPGFHVEAVDTTGAGDVFHGAFCYSVLERMPLREALEFSNAMAARNTTALGARGAIEGIGAVRSQMNSRLRNRDPRIELRLRSLLQSL